MQDQDIHLCDNDDDCPPLRFSSRKQEAEFQKRYRNKKSMSALPHFMQPISSTFDAGLQPSSGARKTPAELNFTPPRKPALVISLMEAHSAYASFILCS